MCLEYHFCVRLYVIIQKLSEHVGKVKEKLRQMLDSLLGAMIISGGTG